MTLGEKQRAFVRAVGAFLEATKSLPRSVEFTFGDVSARDGHRPESCHYIHLAMDLNLFINGVYITTYEQAPDIWDALGRLWKETHPLARWGGDFRGGPHDPDLDHFSFEHLGRK